ncbi:hypothetical protein EJ02DRAFT_66239 [Clathrospora elynae]|uniref:REJ domain-containing protein n=1 Tax=Clathrospora elynae TaxID=706981 RepID=A0A6A5T7S2_9PLEO|nr:hypothetical protein EJ02DRAFT_66239 [Clathrospora elynae]
MSALIITLVHCAASLLTTAHPRLEPPQLVYPAPSPSSTPLPAPAPLPFFSAPWSSSSRTFPLSTFIYRPPT